MEQELREQIEKLLECVNDEETLYLILLFAEGTTE